MKNEDLLQKGKEGSRFTNIIGEMKISNKAATRSHEGENLGESFVTQKLRLSINHKRQAKTDIQINRLWILLRGVEKTAPASGTVGGFDTF